MESVAFGDNGYVSWHESEVPRRLCIVRFLSKIRNSGYGIREVVRASGNSIWRGPAARAPSGQFVLMSPTAGRSLLAVQRSKTGCDIEQEVGLALQSYR